MAQLPVIYASMSGNSEFLANQIADYLNEKHSIDAEARLADLLSLEELSSMDFAVFVIPTWGRGEIPADAERLHDEIQHADGNPLTSLTFSLLAPGDKQYPDYCQAGKTFAQSLEDAGATKAADILMLDGIPVEKYEDDVKQWVDGWVEKIPAETQANA
jgi:sulfite reductase (NADPH) flavoprotein alpha-component